VITSLTLEGATASLTLMGMITSLTLEGATASLTLEA
jgi:hypothetical protein